MPADDILDVLVIGAGFAGVCAGIKLLEKGITNFKIIEKNKAIGGTWYENTYPGAKCDVPSHLYCFSFEPNARWSRRYAPQAEILSYIERCADKYALGPYITYGRHVVDCRFDEMAGGWETRFADGKVIRSRHVISAIGTLHIPKIPDFPGKDSFQGEAMHSTRWNHAFDFENKRVAVIGSAASAIQIIPELAKVAQRLYVFQRTPNYIAPRNDRAYTEAEKARFQRWPFLNRLLRWCLFLRLDLFVFRFINKNSGIGPKAATRIKGWLRRIVKDEKLHESLSPGYQIGCKRILISDDYYATLNRENVTLISDGLVRIDETGIHTADDSHHKVDAIVYATGFDFDKHISSINVVGLQGRRLSEVWEDIPSAYRGVCVAGFPNFWFVTGPNALSGTNSIVFMIEHAVRFILECIDLAGQSTAIHVKPQAMRAYNDEIQAAFGDTVWNAGGCRSWYMRHDGRIATLYPFNARSWRRQMKRVRREDFVFQPVPTQFAKRAIGPIKARALEFTH